MKALAVHKVSNSALDNILGDVSETRIQTLHEAVSAAMHERGIELDADLAAIFQRPRGICINHLMVCTLII